MAKKTFKNLDAVDKFISKRQDEDAQEVQGTYDAHHTQAEDKSIKRQKPPRINMAFYGDNHKYLGQIASINGVSITQYVNDLVAKDREINQDKIKKVREIMEEE